MRRRKTEPSHSWRNGLLLLTWHALVLAGLLVALDGCATPSVIIPETSELPDSVVTHLEGWFDEDCGVAPEEWQRDFCRWYWYIYEPELDANHRAQEAIGG